MSRSSTRFWAVLFFGTALAVSAFVATTTREAEAGAAAWLDRDSIEAVRVAGGLEVRCAITNPLGQETAKPLTVLVTDLAGKPILTGSRVLSLAPGRRSYSVVLEGELDEEQAPLQVLRYELGALGQSEKGARSLLHALAQLETRLLAYNDLQAGSTASLRLVALNHATSEPAHGADVIIKLVLEDAEHTLFTGKTGPSGAIDARFPVPDDASGGGELHIEVTAEGLGTDSIVQPVSVKRDTKILLTTDKPLYQPGQRIQMRALSLRAADLKPASHKAVLFEVMDSKGNKVFKRQVDSGDFGVASADFQLASEVNLGGYTVRAVVAESTAEKQVTVDKYVLPKFKVDVKTDRPYYLPGETLKGDVQADYFFGKPVAGGTVHITASKFEIEFETFAEIDGRLDENGHWSFEIPLPRFFAGTPLEQGQASVRLEAEVVDTADQREEKVVMTPVARADMEIHAVPESGSLAPGLENRVYVLVTYPDGTPAAGVSLLAAGRGLDEARSQDETDALGIAVLSITPEQQGNAKFSLRARDRQGRSAEKTVELSTKAVGESLILRTDKTLCQVGQTLRADVFATKTKGTVYFDMVRQGQTVLTKTADLEAGRASIALDVDATMTGTVALQAYMFTPGADLIRDTRLLYVNPADALEVGIELERDTYKPGEPAQIRFRITDRAGSPTAAAIGIAIVDESVFALQEVHPGLEKVYFTLEKEIMKPRYEIHGYKMDDLVRAPEVPADAALWSEEQQKAARVLLASAPGVPEPPVRINTFDQKRTAADEAILEAYQRDLERIHRAVVRYLEKHGGKAPDDLLKELLRRKVLRRRDLLDPWGNRYEFDFSHVEDWGGYFTMLSYGPDGVKGTDDDISPETPWVHERSRLFGGRFGAPMMRLDRKAGRMVERRVMAEMAAAPGVRLDALGYLGGGVRMKRGEGGGAPGGPEPPRVREYFPETLLFEPALITDERGAATLDVDLADSITTWRMTTMASSRAGALGSREAPLRVFQDFFVDLDLPVALTQNDQVSIPVAVYNYLERPQDVRLEFEQAPWFKLDGPAEQTLELGAGEVCSVYFPIEVVELGKQKLTVFAYGSALSDAIRREIEVLPDGEEQNVTFSDRLSKSVEHTVTVPGNALPGASKILVRVYPGVFSQIVDGLDSMLQMPSGCFEQTSAATYPNILVVQYMKATEQINPELQMKAEGFINAGYQRLLAYEVQGGGFSWFGDAPANKVLTAWGLKEFCDMSQVHEVDPAIIERTRAWLMSQQEADGAWKPDKSYLHAESWAGIQNSNTLVTAYILDALLNAGEGARGASERKAADYIKANWRDSEGEAYTLALVANALASWDKNDAQTQDALAKLHDLRVEEGDVAYWKGGSGTVTFTHGDAANVETTALAAIAFMKAGRYAETSTKALTYLIQQKGAAGHWGSTQATILALKALMAALGNQTEQVNATVTVSLNGEVIRQIKVTPEDSDVMRLLDLGEQTQKGANTVALEIDGEGSMLYQIVGRYYVPWSVRPGPEEPMTIEVAYDKTELAVNDLVTASVKVTNHRPAAAQMVIVDLGIPPGFQVTVPDLEKLVEDGVVEKYELTGRQIILYFEEIAASAAIEFAYSLRAKFPLRAQTPRSRVYQYYNPEVSGAAAPEELVVE